MAGFAAALALGLSRIECNFGVSADSVPVFCYDPPFSSELTRDPSGAWLAAPGPLLRELTTAELPATISVGHGQAQRPRVLSPGNLPPTTTIFRVWRKRWGSIGERWLLGSAASRVQHLTLQQKLDPIHPSRP